VRTQLCLAETGDIFWYTVYAHAKNILCINAMRATHGSESHVDQNYKTGRVTETQLTQRKNLPVDNLEAT
jgi:hypothetical protein